eukprot:5150011-Prymnesium_polylepis.1
MEHFQTGKNNFYEGSARVPFIVAGPGVAAGQIRTEFVSLLDVYPTLLDLAGVAPKPLDLHGRSVAPLLSRGAPPRDWPDHVVGQYHSTFSTTGSFMVRRGALKLIAYGGDQSRFPPQLFNVSADPFELHDLSAVAPGAVKELLALLDGDFDWQAADAKAKAFQRSLYREHVWQPSFNASGGCAAVLNGTFRDFDGTDARRVAAWSGLPCNAGLNAAARSRKRTQEALELRATSDLGDGAMLRRRFWESVGWCPPLPHTNMSAFFMQPSSVLNHIELAAVPQRGIKQVRIHFLLALLHVADATAAGSDSVTRDQAGQYWNFTELDSAMDFLHGLGLQVGFELMGNPDHVFSDWREPDQVARWGAMVGAVARRYTERYGLEWTRTWRFEPWNEPDHACNMERKLDTGIACDLASWLSMYEASSDAIVAVSPLLQMGGPNTGGSTLSSPSFLDALLERVNASQQRRAGGPLKLDFISWHHKGTMVQPSGDKVATSQHITSGDVEIIEHIRAKFPTLAHVPVGNSEADPLGGWSKNISWRGDSRYAAMVVKVVAQRLEELVLNRSLTGLDLDLSSNDAAFLNYADGAHRFSQRTLTATILYNDSKPAVATAVLRKPVLNALALLSFINQHRHTVHWLGGPEVEASQRAAVADIGAIVTSTTSQAEVSVLLYRSADTRAADADTKDATVAITLTNGSFDDNTTVATYRLDMRHASATAVWDAMGRPEYPSRAQLAALRQSAELAPIHVQRISEAALAPGGALTLRHTLELPALHLSHVCAGSLAVNIPPKPQQLMLRAFNATSETDAFVVLSWQAGAGQHACIWSYVVHHATTSAG